MSKNIIIIWRKLGRFFFFSTRSNPKLFLSQNDMVIETQKPGPAIPSTTFPVKTAKDPPICTSAAIVEIATKRRRKNGNCWWVWNKLGYVGDAIAIAILRVEKLKFCRMKTRMNLSCTDRVRLLEMLSHFKHVSSLRRNIVFSHHFPPLHFLCCCFQFCPFQAAAWCQNRQFQSLNLKSRPENVHKKKTKNMTCEWEDCGSGWK